MVRKNTKYSMAKNGGGGHVSSWSTIFYEEMFRGNRVYPRDSSIKVFEIEASSTNARCFASRSVSLRVASARDVWIRYLIFDHLHSKVVNMFFFFFLSFQC
mmetsp:Transcript_28277/g.42765  ORF Transcript_28277/g.42765 Transcript_28277/m.42765 type:complete len:101 (-) Transcript_28277:1974-2276(-)